MQLAAHGTPATSVGPSVPAEVGRERPNRVRSKAFLDETLSVKGGVFYGLV